MIISTFNMLMHMHITYLYTMIIKLMHVLVMYIVYFGCMNWDKIAWYKQVQTEKNLIHYTSDKLSDSTIYTINNNYAPPSLHGQHCT